MYTLYYTYTHDCTELCKVSVFEMRNTLRKLQFLDEPVCKTIIRLMIKDTVAVYTF